MSGSDRSPSRSRSREKVKVGEHAEGHPTTRNRSTRPPALGSIGDHRSPRSRIRAGTLSTRKSSIVTPRASSSHVTGVETVACGRGRTE